MLLKFLLSYPGLLAAEEVLRTEVFLKESFPNRDLESKQNRFKTISLTVPCGKKFFERLGASGGVVSCPNEVIVLNFIDTFVPWQS